MQELLKIIKTAHPLTIKVLNFSSSVTDNELMSSEWMNEERRLKFARSKQVQCLIYDEFDRYFHDEVESMPVYNVHIIRSQFHFLIISPQFQFLSLTLFNIILTFIACVLPKRIIMNATINISFLLLAVRSAGV